MKRRSLSATGSCLLFLATVPCLQRGTHAQALKPLPPAQVKERTAKLDAHLLPEGATGLEAERSQVMQVAGNPAQTLVPVRFFLPIPGGLVVPGAPAATKRVCGLIAVQGDGTQKFTPTLGLPGSSTEAEECSGLRAIGSVRAGDAHSGLILIYDESSPNAHGTEGVILRWKADGTLEMDEASTNAVSRTLRVPPTVPTVRRALAGRKANSQD